MARAFFNLPFCITSRQFGPNLLRKIQRLDDLLETRVLSQPIEARIDLNEHDLYVVRVDGFTKPYQRFVVPPEIQISFYQRIGLNESTALRIQHPSNPFLPRFSPALL